MTAAVDDLSETSGSLTIEAEYGVAAWASLWATMHAEQGRAELASDVTVVARKNLITLIDDS